MQRPPKKPGGISRTILFLLGILVGIDGTDGGQQEDEFDDVIFSGGGAKSIDEDLSSEGGPWMFVGKALLAGLLFLILLFREKLHSKWCECSIAMEVMAPLTIAIEKFVVKHDIDRENVPMMHRILMAKLTREYDLSAEEDPERKVSLIFSDIESETDKLCAKGGFEREEAVGMHMKKLYQLNKLHARREKLEAEGRKTSLDVWLMWVVAVMFLLLDIFEAVSIALVLLAATQNVQVKMSQCVDWIKVRVQQREVIGRGIKNNVKDQIENEV